MSRRLSSLRTAALLCVAAFGVHQLRYLAAFPGDAERALHDSGHDYLLGVEPLIGLAMAFLFGHLLRRLLFARPGREPCSRAQASATFAAALILVFTAQELSEGWLAAGHPPGLGGVFGAGGWLALPLSVVAAGVLVLFIRAEDAAADTDVVDVRLCIPSVAARPAALAPSGSAAPRARRLPRHLAGRGPPPVLPR